MNLLSHLSGIVVMMMSVFLAPVSNSIVEIGNPPSRSDQRLESVANIAFIMTDFDLVNGTLRQYRISTTGRSSPIRLQIWRPLGAGVYQLISQTWHKPAPWATYGLYPGDNIVVRDGDKIGFLHETRETTLVYDFLPQAPGSSLVTREFSLFLPTESNSYKFGGWVYDPWRFAVAVKVDTDYGVGPLKDETTPLPTSGQIVTIGNKIEEGRSLYGYPGSYILDDYALKRGYLRKFRFYAADPNVTVSLQVWRPVQDDYYALVGEHMVWTGPRGPKEVEAVPAILVQDGDRLGFSTADARSVLGSRASVHLPGERPEHGATTLFHRLQAGAWPPALGDTRYFNQRNYGYIFALAADVDLANAPTLEPIILPQEDQRSVIIAVVVGTLLSIIALLATIFALYHVTRWRGERKQKIRQLLSQCQRETEEDLTSRDRPMEIVTSSTEETSSSLTIQAETLQVTSLRTRGFRDFESQAGPPSAVGEGSSSISSVYAYVHHHGNGRKNLQGYSTEIHPMYPAIPESDSEDSPVPPLPPRRLLGTMSSRAVSFSNSLNNLLGDVDSDSPNMQNQEFSPPGVATQPSTLRLYPDLDAVYEPPIPGYSTVMRETRQQQNRQSENLRGQNNDVTVHTSGTSVTRVARSNQITTSQTVSQIVPHSRKPPCNVTQNIKTASVFDTRQGLYTAAVFDVRIDPLSAAIFDARLRSAGPTKTAISPSHTSIAAANQSVSWIPSAEKARQQNGAASRSTLWGNIRALGQHVSNVGQHSWRVIESLRHPHMRRMTQTQTSSSSSPFYTSTSSPSPQQSSCTTGTSVSLCQQRAAAGRTGWQYMNGGPARRNTPFITVFRNRRPVMVRSHGSYMNKAIPVQNKLQFDVHGYENAVVSMPDKEWVIPREYISLHETLSENENGIVVKAEVFDLHGKSVWHTAAVRMLKETSSDFEKSALLQEMQVMRAIKPHPNVLQLMGCAINKEPLLMVVESCPFGNLQDYLRDVKERNVQMNIAGHNNYTITMELVSFGAQIARGMAYLASLRILHRDLAARSVLLGEGRLCKIYHFGFSRNVIESHQYERATGGRMPIRWMAPESLFQNAYTSKCDVWSLGILLWEIVTLGATPYQGMNAAKVIKNVRKGYRMTRPPHCREELYSVMSQCWKTRAADRPEFDSVAAMLQSLYDQSQDLIQLEKYPEDYYMYMTKGVLDEIV